MSVHEIWITNTVRYKIETFEIRFQKSLILETQ